jgi:hypothetical protein
VRLSSSRGIGVKPARASLVRLRVRRCGCGWDGWSAGSQVFTFDKRTHFGPPD